MHSRACLIWLATALFLQAGAAGAGEVVLHARDLVRLPSGLWRAPALAVPDAAPGLPIVGDGASFAEAARILRELDAASAAHGFGGVLYDNRDRGHSRLQQTLFPRLQHLVYDLPLQSDGADYGLAGAVLLPAVVFGNSSTAITAGPAPRSLTRSAMTRGGLPARMARLYEGNHLHVYPEHRDHDAADLFPANWTYTLTSQGSSGSDQPFLEAIAMTLAAFRPETFARLREEGLVAPTLQMVLRRSLAGVEDRDGYLSGAAHPVVFDAARLRPDRMVGLAASLAPDAIPPLVRLSVVEEDFAAEAGLARLDERLFDTPAAIARIWRGFDHERQMIVSAEATADPNGRPLAFAWRLLQGDPAKVRIEPLDPEGRRARITLRWHDAFMAGDGSAARETSRVDIGVFASNGAADSAPAFVSVSFPTHEKRLYGPGPDGAARLLSVDYDASGRGTYFDPEIHWSAPWRDEAVHDAQGGLAAWRRSASGAPGAVETVPHDAVHAIDRARPQAPLLRGPQGESGEGG